jgi:uncharacterized membrane protein
MGKWNVQDIAFSGLIAALYAVMTILLAPISYGVYQIRLSEVLTILPFLFPQAILGLFAGCLVANIFGGNGLQDIIFGSLFTLVAAYLTYLCSKIKYRKLGMGLAPLPPVIINAFGVAIYLSQIMGMNYFFVVQMIALGELVACYVLGLPLLFFISSKLSRIENRTKNIN